jgi:hypothetical protein
MDSRAQSHKEAQSSKLKGSSKLQTQNSKAPTALENKSTGVLANAKLACEFCILSLPFP